MVRQFDCPALIVLLVSLVLAGCNRAEEETRQPEPPATEAKRAARGAVDVQKSVDRVKDLVTEFRRFYHFRVGKPSHFMGVHIRQYPTDNWVMVEILTELAPDYVIEQHAAATYHVYLLGFAPGFAYLGPLPEPLRVPRRAEPRVRVPAGSVAIAGAQTAVYPHVTPGGWHIIGRSESVLWDPASSEPARLRPGDRVQFVPA